MAAAVVEDFNRAAELTPARFDVECVDGRRPLVLRGLVADWPAAKWGLCDFVAHWPKRPVRAVTTCSDGFTRQWVGLSPSDVAQHLLADPHTFRERSSGWRFDAPIEIPELVEHLPPPRVCRGRWLYYLLFVGRDTFNGAHYHTLRHTLICQVHGTKRFILNPPEDGASLYPHPIWRPHFEISQVDPIATDIWKFPRVAAARPLETLLAPGDALFVPARWWHAAYGTGVTVSATFGWKASMGEHFPRPDMRGLAGSLLWYSLSRSRWVARGAASALTSARELVRMVRAPTPVGSYSGEASEHRSHLG